MDNELIFKAVNIADLIGWLFLIFLPNKKVTQHLVHSGLLPALLSILYVIFLIYAFAIADEWSYSSLASVKAVFTLDLAILAGWVHYLAFDLFFGSWISKQAKALGWPHLIIIPILILTFAAGPVGLLIFWVANKWKDVKLGRAS
jgi:hypothetical protein